MMENGRRKKFIGMRREDDMRSSGGRKEVEWRRKEEERAQRSKEIIRTLAASSAECEPQRPRTKFGVNSLKLTDIKAFMTTFQKSMEAREIKHAKWQV